MELNDIYDLAELLEIEIECMDLPITQSISMEIEGDCYVGIDLHQIKSVADEKVKLLHEIGHCETGSFYNETNSLDAKGRHEWRANKRAVNRGVPYDEMMEVVRHGYIEVWELAEHFDVTEDFIRTTIEIYKATEGI